MSKHLKKFETQSAYEAAQSSLILPNVSLIVDNNTVYYNPSSPTPSFEFVEIGGLKWGTMNVGATAVTDTGLYFQWGDASGYTASQVGTDKVFNWANYKYSNNGSGSASDMTKYNTTDGLTRLEAVDDAATANMGGNWRMPTNAEIQALSRAVNTATTSDYQGSGVSGLICTDKTDSSKVLFFPACGACVDGSIMAGACWYWSSTLYENKTQSYLLNSQGNTTQWYEYRNRYFGLTVRGVLVE